MNKVDNFFDRNILLVAAERPRGTPVFKDLVADPPTGEFEFTALWKLYILTLITQRMRDFGIRGAAANEALIAAGYQLWVLLDRLDVAFAETHALERNALRALFRVYLDLGANEAIKLKIFLRSDIWKRITKEGFREASHITRFVTL